MFQIKLFRRSAVREYMFIFRLNQKTGRKPTPDEAKERFVWFQSIVDRGLLADKGNTLTPANGKVLQSKSLVGEGPFIEQGSFISGYMIVKTETLEQAVELASTNPIFQVGGSIEVREVARFISGGEREVNS